MRYVSVDTSPATIVTGDELKPVAGTHPVRPVAARVNRAVVVRHYKAYLPNRQPLASAEQGEAGRRASPEQERRKAARRLRQLPVLLELRSGLDQRRHNQREGDIVEHIDLKA